MGNLYNKKCQCESCTEWRRGYNESETDARCRDNFKHWSALSKYSVSFQNGYRVGQAKFEREIDEAFHNKRNREY